MSEPDEHGAQGMAIVRTHFTFAVAMIAALAYSMTNGVALAQNTPKNKKWGSAPGVSVTVHSNAPSFSRPRWELEFADVAKNEARLVIQVLGDGQQARTSSHIIIDAYDKPEDNADAPYPQTLADMFRDVASNVDAGTESGVTYDLALVPWGIAVYQIKTDKIAKSWIWIHHPLSTIVRIRMAYLDRRAWKIPADFVAPRELNGSSSRSPARDLTAARERRDELIRDPRALLNDSGIFARSLHPTHLARRITLAALGAYSLNIASGVQSPTSLPAALGAFLQKAGVHGPAQLEQYLFATFGVGSSKCVEREKQVFADNQRGTGSDADIRIGSLPPIITSRPTTCGGEWFIDLTALL